MPILAASAVDAVRDSAHLLSGAADDFDPLLEQVGDARFVLLGEASHGTHEFYRTRCEITKRLICEKQVCAVAVEADWPDAYRVNRYVQNRGNDADAVEALGDFQRFPTWMWRNADIVDFIGWLRDHNDQLPARAQKIGFYGLDLYSLNNSIYAVLNYLDRIDPEAARRARHRYGCFEHFGRDPQSYGYAASSGLAETCEQDVVNQLVELRRRAADYAARDGRVAEDEFFFAEQNALLVKNAEEYYRSMFRGRVSSWNLRDRHMAETLQALTAHLEKRNQSVKIALWAHNSHLGDARATQMGQAGEWNVGQLVRERYQRDAILIGFTTYTGTVTAAANWDQPAERKNVLPAMHGSIEALFHETALPRFFLPLHEPPIIHTLSEPLLERAIGVVYRPDTERQSHYFYARLPQQFDGLLHFDVTRAVEPLERLPIWDRGEMLETFPTGI